MPTPSLMHHHLIPVHMGGDVTPHTIPHFNRRGECVCDCPGCWDEDRDGCICAGCTDCTWDSYREHPND